MTSYDQPANDAVDFTLQSYNQPTNDSVDFDLAESGGGGGGTGQSGAGPFRVGGDPLEIPMRINIPLRSVSFSTMQTGTAVFLIGLLTFTGGASALLRNYASMALLGLAVVALLMSGTLGISMGYFWALMTSTIVVMMAGVAFRVVET